MKLIWYRLRLPIVIMYLTFKSLQTFRTVTLLLVSNQSRNICRSKTWVSGLSALSLHLLTAQQRVRSLSDTLRSRTVLTHYAREVQVSMETESFKSENCSRQLSVWATLILLALHKLVCLTQHACYAQHETCSGFALRAKPRAQGNFTKF